MARSAKSFSDLVAPMVDGDVRLLEEELAGQMVRVDREHQRSGRSREGTRLIAGSEI